MPSKEYDQHIEVETLYCSMIHTISVLATKLVEANKQTESKIHQEIVLLQLLSFFPVQPPILI